MKESYETDCLCRRPVAHVDLCLPTSGRTAAGPSATIAGRPGNLLRPDGLIVHHGPNGELDGGDTSQREGWYWLGVWIRQNTAGLQSWSKPRSLTFEQVLDLLEPNHDGVFYRHPKLPPWNNPHGKHHGFSRDQMEPLVAAMGVWGKKAEIRRLWDALPEDLLGKHAFNGNWRKPLGLDGQDCSAIKKRSCDSTAVCSLKTDERDCSLKVDRSDCSLKKDNSNCRLRRDRRSCRYKIKICLPWPHNNQCHTRRINRPDCEIAKLKANAAYKIEHDECEVKKLKQNVNRKREHDECEIAKGGKDLAYKADHDRCEAGKVGQNLLYKGEHDACEAEKTARKLACEGQKALDQSVCMATNVHSGDLIGPMTVNLFRRAMGEDPTTDLSQALRLPPVDTGSGLLGETELAANVRLRVAAARKDKSDTGDDLNLIVKMLMSELRFPTPISQRAVKAYSADRPYSYGSYFVKYEEVYGTEREHLKDRIAAGIRSGWQTDCSAPVGAVRWYHRPDTGANPQLAELYVDIIDKFIN